MVRSQDATARRYPFVSQTITGLCHSRVPFGKKRLASAGAISHRKDDRAQSANATVQAIGLNNRPSTRCSVKMGR
jgi:hypothetical protein